ncbi:Nn.00g057270.m01.CDS01 [Neocucurbitaria sp. VM-36]
MSAFRDIMSIVDPTAPKTPTAPKQAAPAGAAKPVPRPAAGPNGASQTPQLKRKASGPVESNQAKIQRKEGDRPPAQTNGVVRSSSTPAVARPNPPTTTSTVPYRGTAAPASAKTANPVVRKPVPPSATSSVPPKAAAPVPRPVPAATSSTTASAAAPKKGYLALLQKAKEKDATKPVAPPVKHEPTKILSRKERLALKAEASAGAKGKKSGVGLPSRHLDSKVDPSKDKRKPAEVGYQGTARPTKKPVEIGYRGTARPASAPAPSSQNGISAGKAKSQPAKGRYDGYADWDDLDDMDDEEDNYASDASSDMEGGVWDVEEEEQMALKVAKKEDAEALAEEMRLKREKEERKRKLLAMSKAAAAKRRY